jgi:hypothetical protein
VVAAEFDKFNPDMNNHAERLSDRRNFMNAREQEARSLDSRIRDGPIRGVHMSGRLSHRRPWIVDNVPTESISAAAHDIASLASEVHVLAVGTRAINWPVHHDLGDIAGNVYMAHFSNEREAEREIVLESGGDLRDE